MSVVLSSNRFLEFDLGAESFAVPLLTVKEVIPVPDTTPMPNAGDHFVGIMNLRGQIISVIDLRKKMKVKKKEVGLEEAVVIVEMQGVSIGLIVDSINKVLTITSGDVSPVPELKSQINARFIQGVYRGPDKLTVLIDIESILNIQEIKAQSKKAA